MLNTVCLSERQTSRIIASVFQCMTNDTMASKFIQHATCVISLMDVGRSFESAMPGNLSSRKLGLLRRVQWGQSPVHSSKTKKHLSFNDREEEEDMKELEILVLYWTTFIWLCHANRTSNLEPRIVGLRRFAFGHELLIRFLLAKRLKPNQERRVRKS